nr:hypothetical protein [Tanacetum cinerariifolium]
MKGIQDAIATKTIPPNTNREIFDEVLKITNRAHTAGVVRLLVGTGNSDSGRPQPNTSYYTQEKLEDLKRQHALEIEEQRKVFESQQNVLKKLWISLTVNKVILLRSFRFLINTLFNYFSVLCLLLEDLALLLPPQVLLLSALSIVTPRPLMLKLAKVVTR